MTDVIRFPRTDTDYKVLAESIIDRMQRLGLMWRLRPGTVVEPAADGTVRVLGDDPTDTTPMRVVSLIGPVPVDARVMLILSPPSGAHIIGYLGPRPPYALGVVAHIERDTASTAASGAQGVLRLDDVPVYAGRRYEVYTSSLLMFSSVAADVGTARFSHTTDGTTPTTGSPLLQIWNGPAIPSTANGVGGILRRDYQPSTDHNLSVLLFTQRLSGTGLISLFASGNHRTELIIEDKGPVQASQGTGTVI